MTLRLPPGVSLPGVEPGGVISTTTFTDELPEEGGSADEEQLGAGTLS
jgi:hypothetical protein